MARAADRSQFDLNIGPGNRPHVGVAVDAQHPGDIGRDFLAQFEDRGGDLVDFGARLRPQLGLADLEQQFGLQHEAVADNADVGTVAEDFAQAAEEVGAVFGQFLDLLRQRQIEPLAEIGDVGLRFLVLLFRSVERLLRWRPAGGAAPRSAG